MGDLAYWPSAKPLSKKDKFAKNRDYIENLNHIDQIWENLKFKCGDTLAVSDLRGKYKEKLLLLRKSSIVKLLLIFSNFKFLHNL